jgi:hypothetical protein
MVGRIAATGRFPAGIFWFDAEHPDLTATWGSTIADALAVGPGSNSGARGGRVAHRI